MRSNTAIMAFALAHLASRTEASELVGGVLDPHDAVVWVSSSVGSCTGTYIAPGVVLTAGHCVPEGESAPGAVLVGFAGALPAARPVLGSQAVARFDGGEPRLDLAIVALDERHVPAGVVPLPVLPAELALAGEDVGSTVVLVGFGAEEPPGAMAAAGTRQSGPSTLTAIEAERATVTSTSTQARACFGDSGGPLLLSREGVEYVAAVLSTGAADCSGTDHYVRVDAGRGARFVGERSSMPEGGCAAAGGGSGLGGALSAVAAACAARRKRRRRPYMCANAPRHLII